ncbi:MAG: ferredoxin [Pseudonocardia sp.]
MRIVVDYQRCNGLGLCEATAPDYFEVQDDGTLALLREDADEGDRAILEEAVAGCPTEALRLEG